MVNLWLNIPAADYEGHMGSPNVDQLSFLACTFKETLEHHDCDTVALLGCATGNGLEYVKRGFTRRVTAVDINPEYLEVLRQRYGNSVPGLKVVQDDLESCELDKQAYSLIFAGLVFEYLEPQALLQRIAKWLQMDGILVAVLQMPAEGASVTETPYTSLKSLNSIMSLIDPNKFKIIADAVGLMAIEEKFITLETGKSFYIDTYKKST
jgi:ubiquinone/menaquinone biosynthesis C-methylase UbiE